MVGNSNEVLTFNTEKKILTLTTVKRLKMYISCHNYLNFDLTLIVLLTLTILVFT